jgi:spastin
VRRIYIPLPEAATRAELIAQLLSQQSSALSHADLAMVVAASHGFSGSDLSSLCKDAAMGPVRPS